MEIKRHILKSTEHTADAIFFTTLSLTKSLHPSTCCSLSSINTAQNMTYLCVKGYFLLYCVFEEDASLAWRRGFLSASSTLISNTDGVAVQGTVVVCDLQRLYASDMHCNMVFKKYSPSLKDVGAVFLNLINHPHLSQLIHRHADTAFQEIYSPFRLTGVSLYNHLLSSFRAFHQSCSQSPAALFDSLEFHLCNSPWYRCFLYNKATTSSLCYRLLTLTINQSGNASFTVNQSSSPAVLCPIVKTLWTNKKGPVCTYMLPTCSWMEVVHVVLAWTRTFS